MLGSLMQAVVREYLTFFGATLCLLFVISYAFLKARALKIHFLMVVLGALSVLLYYSWHIQSPLHDPSMRVPPLHVPVVWILGPAILHFSRAMLDHEYTPSRSLYIQFLPPLLVIGWSVFFYFMSDSSAGAILDFYTGAPTQAADILFIGGFGVNFIYYLFLLHETRYFWNREVLGAGGPVRYLMIMIILCFVITAAALCAVLFRSLDLLHALSALISLVVMAGFIIHLRYPEFFLAVQSIAMQVKYKRSLLQGVNTDQIAQRIRSLMEDDKIFSEEDLSLPGLAKHLDLTAHQLSEYLNRELKKNFNSFINQYRIEEAKKLLLEENEETVLSIAFKVGFNSKSTFNSVFMKLTGQSPTSFRRRN